MTCQLDLVTPGAALPRIGQLAREAQAGGFSGLVFVESGRTAFLSATAAARQLANLVTAD
jgi:hypothetical protein